MEKTTRILTWLSFTGKTLNPKGLPSITVPIYYTHICNSVQLKSSAKHHFFMLH